MAPAGTASERCADVVLRRERRIAPATWPLGEPLLVRDNPMLNLARAVQRRRKRLSVAILWSRRCGHACRRQPCMSS